MPPDISSELCFRQHRSASAVSLQYFIVILQHHDIRVMTGGQLSLAVINAQTASRIDRAGIDRRVNRYQRILDQDLQTVIHGKRAARNRVSAL